MLHQSALNLVPYYVQSGDTYYKISRYFNISLDDLIDANPDIHPNRLIVGDMVLIPLAVQEISCPVDSEAYTTQAGDTIYSISEKFKIKTNTLLKANHRINPDILLPGQIIYIPKPWSEYHNTNYKIELMYPTRWAMVTQLYYEGLDGFFRIAGLKSEASLEELCRQEAYHKLKPYGSIPNIIKTTVDNNNACIVLPSIDQPKEMKKQAAMILEYPMPIEIDNKTFSHIILWIDSEHIEFIKNSIKLTF